MRYSLFYFCRFSGLYLIRLFYSNLIFVSQKKVCSHILAVCRKLNILDNFLKIKQTSLINQAPNLYKAVTAELSKHRAKIQSKKATTVRKGGRATQGDPVMNYVESDENDEEFI
jgi:hypothetical protein